MREILDHEAMEITGVTPICIPVLKTYRLNVDNIRNISDLKSLLRGLNVQFYLEEGQVEPIKHMLEEVL